MLNSVNEVFSDKQLSLLKSRMWWLADGDKPFLVKFAQEGDYALMQVSNLKNLWVARIHFKTLLEDKAKYAKSLEIKDKKDLMTLFDNLLSVSDPLALYQFTQNSSGDISFTFKKRIQIFDFRWIFKLQKVSCNPVDLICRQLLSPLSMVLEAQIRRIELLRKKFTHIQKDYVRKMTQMERKLYKSPLQQESKQEWLKLVPKSEGKLLSLFPFEKASQFFFQNLSSQEKKVEVEPHSFAPRGGLRPLPVQPEHEDFQIGESILTEQIEMEIRRKKKEKKIDFI